MCWIFFRIELTMFILRTKISTIFARRIYGSNFYDISKYPWKKNNHPSCRVTPITHFWYQTQYFIVNNFKCCDVISNISRTVILFFVYIFICYWILFSKLCASSVSYFQSQLIFVCLVYLYVYFSKDILLSIHFFQYTIIWSLKNYNYYLYVKCFSFFGMSTISIYFLT